MTSSFRRNIPHRNLYTQISTFQIGWLSFRLLWLVLSAYRNYTDGNYSYQMPTTLNYGQYSHDQYGNTFPVDPNNQYYRWTNWGWQPLTNTNGR